MKFFPSGLRAYFLVLFTGRRNFIPILSVYYLTLPNTNAAELGLYTGLWFLASFIFNVPGGMLADRFGYKNTLILTKILLIGSSACFLTADGFFGFLVWSVLSALWMDALGGWTASSYLRDLLASQWRKSEYKKISSAIRADVSLISIAFIIGLPFLTEIDIKLPLLVGLIFDLIWLFAAFFLKEIEKEGGTITRDSSKGIITLIQEAWWTPFFPLSVFSAVIAGCLIGESVFRIPYLNSIWLPLVLSGVVMWASRFVWFLVWRSVSVLDRIFTPKKLLLFDLFFFSGYYALITLLTNPYLLAVIFAIGIGYFWGRSELYSDLVFDHIQDPRYKATMMSIRSQFTNIVQICVMIWVGIIMNYSYRLWFWILWWALLAILLPLYILSLRKHLDSIANREQS